MVKAIALLNIDVYVVPVENSNNNRRTFERLMAAAAVNAVGATNETIPKIKHSGQGRCQKVQGMV